MNIADIRKDYQLKSLDETDVLAEPIGQFKVWWEEALKAEVPEVNAMTLSTVNSEGRPTGRIVLLKGLEEGGFVFYTNYESRKGKELAENPFACLTFHWVSLERQVRIEGKVQKVDGKVSTEYFQSRPKGSQIGAWVSPQSQVIPNREFLEEKNEALQAKYEDAEVLDRPDHWGGYVLIPDKVEFWQGRSSRLHVWLFYELEDGKWSLKRLAP